MTPEIPILKVREQRRDGLIRMEVVPAQHTAAVRLIKVNLKIAGHLSAQLEEALVGRLRTDMMIQYDDLSARVAAAQSSSGG